VLEPETGEKVGEINLPGGVTESWSIIRVVDDFLVGGCGQSLVCMNRQNGDLLWRQKRQAKIGCLALGGGRVFCADFVQRRRGAPTPDAQIDAFDLETGRVLWQASGGPDIRFCEASDLLCTSNGVYRGGDGERLWAGSVYLVAGDKLISGGNSQVAYLDPKTGQQMGKQLQWNLRGCTMLRGSSTLLSTRFMGNAAYLDIATGRITSIWNVRAACSNNLFPADGVLNVPNLSGGCTCNYMPVSQALVPTAVVDRLAASPPTEK
jgi:outer membrane protein assembly factor BamB